MTSRAFTELYSIDNKTAAYVRMLMEMGAIIVGKTRMSSFAVGEDPTDQWIDFHCPFTPRGDEYQGPDSSSSGAAASLAGYSWLDYSIGTDSKYTADAFVHSFNLIKTQPLVAFEAPQQLTVCTVSDLPLAMARLMVFSILHGKPFLVSSLQHLLALVGMI